MTYRKPTNTKTSREREGILHFGERRITIESDTEITYVHPPRAEGYIHGDRVAYIMIRPEKDGKLAESRPIRLIRRSTAVVIIEAVLTKKGTVWSLLPVFGKLRIEVTANPRVEDGDLYKAKFTSGRRCELIEKFGNKNDPEIRESLLLFQAGVRTEWPGDVENYVPERLSIDNTFNRGMENISPVDTLGTQRGSGENTVGDRGDQNNDERSERVYHPQGDPPRPLVTFGHESNINLSEEISRNSGLLHSSQGRNGQKQFGSTPLPQSLSLKSEIFPKVRVNGRERLDFRSWYTMTIDGADAQDLDDAISIARYEGGDTLLAVHIADVAEYVIEGSPIDREAYLRGTSIYLPGRVIPMLPEILSNDLCSLHPGGPKLCMSILMRIDRSGLVKESYVTEGIIESRHRGVYEEIGEQLKMKNEEGRISQLTDKSEVLDTRRRIDRVRSGNGVKIENQNEYIIARNESASVTNVVAIHATSLGASRCATVGSHTPEYEHPTESGRHMRGVSIQEEDSLDPLLHSGGRKKVGVPLDILSHFSHLYSLLQSRRKKEGKIIFDMTECYFDMDAGRNVENIRKRARGEAHMMIEEFMVLANEEVAKWCVKRNIPFLSRVHEAPSAEKTREIHEVIRANTPDSFLDAGSSDSDIEPHHIRSILEHAKSDEELYRLSRLLLPKMAKAVYMEKPVRHFGLALTHYAHFTSPIRRYPDLLLHRMIKYHLSKMSNFDKKKYDNEMKRWGKSLSEKERNAEDVSRSIDDLYMCLYMSKYVDRVEEGIISGLTESNIYVELSNGVEGSIYLKNPLRSREEPKTKGDLARSSPLIKREPRGFDSRERLTLDLARGSLRNPSGEEVYRIGEKIRVKILSVDLDTRRIEMAETYE